MRERVGFHPCTNVKGILPSGAFGLMVARTGVEASATKVIRPVSEYLF